MIPTLEMKVSDMFRSDVPAWVTSEEGKNDQNNAWEAVAAELEKIQPGCVKSILA